MSLPYVTLPGQELGLSSKYHAGPGTHLHNSQICASIAGTATLVSAASPDDIPRPNPNSASPVSSRPAARPRKGIQKQTITVTRPARSPTTINTSSPPPPLLPQVHSSVLALVTRLTPRAATLSILAIGTPSSSSPSSPTSAPAFHWTPTPRGAEPPAQLRPQDVRATEKDTVVLREALHVGDIVRGVVVSLGDQAGGFYISTAGNENGVVLARAEESGRDMMPISWREFAEVDPETGEVTGVREVRKVARPLGMG